MKFKKLLRLGVMALILTIIVSSLSPVSAQPNRPWMNTSLTAEARRDLLLKEMTLEEKVSFVTGNMNNNYGFYNAPLERLGIPALQMADGPAGVRVANPNIQGKKSTALPAPLSLAATWDVNAAKTYGDLIGNEAFNTTHNVLLGPGLDIARFPWGARNFESLGEDPLLQSRIGTAYVQGVQQHPVIATGKHYLLNNQETNRFTINSKASERTIQEIYARPFGDIIKNADMGSVMCSFNKVNGTFACENGPLLTDILRKQFNFQGFVMSDYGANKSTAASALAGLDLETPGDPIGLWGDKLLAAVRDGKVTEQRINEMAGRTLLQMFRKKLFDQPVQNNQIPARAHGETARKLAEQGMVLLKNRNSALPLDRKKVKTIAVIGPDADNASAAGGGSSLVNPTYTVSPLEGIRNKVGQNVTVTYSPGSDPISAGDILPGPSAVPSSLLTSTDGTKTGLNAEYWTNINFEGNPSLVRVDPQVNLNLGFYNYGGFNAQSPKLPSTPTDFNNKMSARWTGNLTPPGTGNYTLSLTSLGSGKLYVNDQLFIENNNPNLTTTTKKMQLTSGQKYKIRIEYSTGEPSPGAQDFGGMVRFGWVPPAGAIDPAMRKAVDLASKSDVAVIVTRTYESEGYVDPSHLDLPNNQEQLIKEVAKVNRKTIVVQMSGRPVQMNRWQNDVSGIIQAWFAGQEQGNAVANVLFGDVNPSGKLPVTFPVDEKSTPVSNPAQFPGVNGESQYSEGVFVGYKGYARNKIKPAYPFGFGLSYTTFGYRNLKATAKGDNVQVSLNLRNTGKRTGSEVIQVYAGKLPAKVETPIKQLAGFAKVNLAPGKQQRVTITLDPKALSYWDETTHKWVMPTGKVPIYVGSSSEDIRLSGNVTIGR
ncbi:beta-glucosidase H [Neobacillus sp. Marseille-QA0830]